MSTQVFSWRHAVISSALSPTTRHVLLTLACHVSDAGDACFPSIDQLVAETGLSRRSVIDHLHAAQAAGWLLIGLHGFRGQKWRSHEYVIAVPAGGISAPETVGGESLPNACLWEDVGSCGDRIAAEGGERAAPPLPEGGERAAPPLPKVVNVLHHLDPLPSPPVDNKHTPHPSPTKDQEQDQNNTPPEGPPKWRPPDGLNLVAWAEFEAHRRDTRKPLSDLARTRAANLLLRLNARQQQECVDYSIVGRYTGLYPERFGGGRPGGGLSQIERSEAAITRALGEDWDQNLGDGPFASLFRRNRVIEHDDRG